MRHFLPSTISAALLATTAMASAGHNPPSAQSEYAVAYQINTAHSGSIEFAGGFAGPLKQLWSVDLGESASYPLVADGKVYVLGNGFDLFALDLVTGSKKWEHLLSGGNMGAYDNGQLFYVNFDGLLTALAAKSGKQKWSVSLPGQYAFSSPPIALKGQVFTGGAGSGGTLYGVDEATGAVQWTQSVANGDDSSPAFGDGGLYVSYPCQYYKFATNGQPLWHYSGGCDGGGGATPSYFKKRVYIQDWASGNYVLNADKGTIVGTYSGNATPSFFTAGNGRGYGLSISGGKLYCFDVKTENVAWSFGTGSLVGNAVVVNGQPIVGGNDGHIYLLDGDTGSQTWSGSVSSGISYLAAGQGALVVSAGNTVTAFGPQ